MGRLKTNLENIQGIKSSLEVIEIGINAYNSGKLASWQPIVVELYKLLVDKSSGPLAVLVFPHLHLHPMLIIIPPLKKGDTPDLLFDPVRKYFKPGEKIKVEIFDETKAKIPLSKWLQQIFLVSNSYYFTIEKYLDILRHNEGAHYATKTGRQIEATKLWLIIEQGTTQTNIEKYMAALGQYILNQLKGELSSPMCL